VQGERGKRGKRGSRGAKGLTGDSGNQGSPGATGPAGPTIGTEAFSVYSDPEYSAVLVEDGGNLVTAQVATAGAWIPGVANPNFIGTHFEIPATGTYQFTVRLDAGIVPNTQFTISIRVNGLFQASTLSGIFITDGVLPHTFSTDWILSATVDDDIDFVIQNNSDTDDVTVSNIVFSGFRVA